VTDEPKFSQQDHGKRVRVTDRNGRVYYGTIRGVMYQPNFVDIDTPDSKRDPFYFPADMVELVSDDDDSVVPTDG
jgi:hypothetical protein